MENKETFGFEKAFELLKQGDAVTRLGFRDTCYIRAQFPNENSKMTLPYLYMVKGESIFPVTLSDESLFANDWYVKPYDFVQGRAKEFEIE